MINTYAQLRSLALSLNLPQVVDSTAWGHPCLKAHGKMWCWWSPYSDAAVFKCDKAEREFLLSADPTTYTLHPHYEPHNLILARAGHIAPDWATARLIRQWREAAPKRWLKSWDAETS